jgi:glucokinase
MQRLAAGIDIGGTNTVIGLVSAAGRILARASVRTNDFPSPEEFVEEISRKISGLLPPDPGLLGIGIGAPNGNFFRGTIEFAPNLQWKGVIPLVKMVAKKLKVKTYLTNDANAAALGEKIFGGAKKINDFIVITLGTGVGSGIVVNGKLVYGHDGFAGEIGHTIVEKNGRFCGCGRRGCMETYCSATGIVKTYIQLVSGANKEIAADALNAEMIFERAKSGEKEAVEAFNFTGEILGFSLANSVAHTSPEAIFLLGGLAKAGRFLFGPVKKSLEKNLLPIYRNRIKILPSKLPENNAAILGGASLVFADK